MPVEVICTACNKRLRAPDNAVGKKIRCPKCQSLLSVSADLSRLSAEKWYMQTPDGQQFGPVSRIELDGWLGQGRITAECQLLLEGAPAWQWASEVYPIVATQPSLSDSSKKASLSGSGSFNFLGDSSSSAAAGSSKSSKSSSDSFVFGRQSGGSTVSDSIVTTGSFIASSSSSLSRKSSGGKTTGGKTTISKRAKKKAGIVTALGIVNYVFGGLKLLTAIAFFVGGAALAALITGAAAKGGNNGLSRADAGALAGAVGAGIIFVGVLLLISAGMSIAAGYGVMERKQWGRILTLVLGVLSGLTVLASVVTLNLGGLISLAYCIFVFVVLLNKDNAAEFR